MRGYTRAQLADLVREVGLPAALNIVQPEQIDDGELYRWWARAQTALKEIDCIVKNCQGAPRKSTSSFRPDDGDIILP